MVLDSIFDLYHLGYTLDFTLVSGFSSVPSISNSYSPLNSTLSDPLNFLFNDPLRLNKSLNIGLDFPRPSLSYDMGLPNTSTGYLSSVHNPISYQLPYNSYGKNNLQLFGFNTNNINPANPSPNLLSRFFPANYSMNGITPMKTSDSVSHPSNNLFNTSHTSSAIGINSSSNPIFGTGFNTTEITKVGGSSSLASINTNLFNTNKIVGFNPSDRLNSWDKTFGDKLSLNNSILKPDSVLDGISNVGTDPMPFTKTTRDFENMGNNFGTKNAFGFDPFNISNSVENKVKESGVPNLSDNWLSQMNPSLTFTKPQSVLDTNSKIETDPLSIKKPTADFDFGSMSIDFWKKNSFGFSPFNVSNSVEDKIKKSGVPNLSDNWLSEINPSFTYETPDLDKLGSEFNVGNDYLTNNFLSKLGSPKPSNQADEKPLNLEKNEFNLDKFSTNIQRFDQNLDAQENTNQTSLGGSTKVILRDLDNYGVKNLEVLIGDKSLGNLFFKKADNGYDLAFSHFSNPKTVIEHESLEGKLASHEINYGIPSEIAKSLSQALTKFNEELQDQGLNLNTQSLEKTNDYFKISMHDVRKLVASPQYLMQALSFISPEFSELNQIHTDCENQLSQLEYLNELRNNLKDDLGSSNIQLIDMISGQMHQTCKNIYSTTLSAYNKQKTKLDSISLGDDQKLIEQKRIVEKLNRELLVLDTYLSDEPKKLTFDQIENLITNDRVSMQEYDSIMTNNEVHNEDKISSKDKLIILNNLYTNALKASNGEKEDVKLHCIDGDDELFLQVKNPGQIPSKFLKNDDSGKKLELFNEGVSSKENSDTLTGIGMSEVYSIVDRLGGKIVPENRVDDVVFTVKIPKVKNELLEEKIKKLSSEFSQFNLDTMDSSSINTLYDYLNKHQVFEDQDINRKYQFIFDSLMSINPKKIGFEDGISKQEAICNILSNLDQIENSTNTRIDPLPYIDMSDKGLTSISPQNISYGADDVNPLLSTIKSLSNPKIKACLHNVLKTFKSDGKPTQLSFLKTSESSLDQVSEKYGFEDLTLDYKFANGLLLGGRQKALTFMDGSEELDLYKDKNSVIFLDFDSFKKEDKALLEVLEILPHEFWHKKEEHLHSMDMADKYVDQFVTDPKEYLLKFANFNEMALDKIDDNKLKWMAKLLASSCFHNYMEARCDILPIYQIEKNKDESGLDYKKLRNDLGNRLLSPMRRNLEAGIENYKNSINHYKNPIKDNSLTFISAETGVIDFDKNALFGHSSVISELDQIAREKAKFHFIDNDDAKTKFNDYIDRAFESYKEEFSEEFIFKLREKIDNLAKIYVKHMDTENLDVKEYDLDRLKEIHDAALDLKTFWNYKVDS